MLRVRGARVHNLRDLDVDLPHDRLVVITGPSGSGKSTLAFDTLYAEGKRQFIATLSPSARKLLDQVPRPDVDSIDELRPTLCIDQHPGFRNPRATVATLTEIHDHLRVLMARLGDVSCHACDSPIRQHPLGEIVAQAMQLPEGTRLIILAPMPRQPIGSLPDQLARIRHAGLVRVRLNGAVAELDQLPPNDPDQPFRLEAVIDRLVIRPGLETRLTESIQTALEMGQGVTYLCHSLPPGAAAGALRSEEPEWRDLVFSTRHACPACGTPGIEMAPRAFSFNSPYGACSACGGLGAEEGFDPGLVVAYPDEPLPRAVAPWQEKGTVTAKFLRALQEELISNGLSTDLSWNRIPAATQFALLHGPPAKSAEKAEDDQAEPRPPSFRGILAELEREFATTLDESRWETLGKYRGEIPCAACQGLRLRPESLRVRVGDRNLAEITALSVDAALEFLSELRFPEGKQAIATPLLAGLRSRLEFLQKVGLGFLTLDRGGDTLSGGEYQRVRLATSIGSGLVGICYILDEPSIGLHPQDTGRLIETLQALKQQGNSVIVVEHDAELIRVAEHVIDLGPGAGPEGGTIVAQGSLGEILAATTSMTGAYLSGERRIPIPTPRRTLDHCRCLELLQVTTHNLQGVDLRIPLGGFVCVTGVSGSGKSSLIHHTLAPAVLRALGLPAPVPGPHRALIGMEQIKGVVRIDQSPMGRSARGNAATYTGVMDRIRKIFAATREAKQRGYTAARFSFNNKEGRCPACQGHGERRIDLAFLPDLYVPCLACGGDGFNQQTLDVKFHGRSIGDVLRMRISEAAELFASVDEVARGLQALERVGLGYLSLGQRGATFSGGEAQRVKLGRELARVESGETLYLLDEPTRGLHFDDIRRLLEVLQALVDRGNTMLVVEHNVEVIKTADWVIDLGPGGGVHGGRIVAAGTPEQLAADPSSPMGRYLREPLGT